MTTYFYFFMLLASITSTDALEMPTQQLAAPTVNAGQDVVICDPGQSVTLTATTSPDVIYYEWSPIQFLSNPFQQSVLATVGSTTTFTVTVGSPPVVNLFSNGDFADPDFGSFFFSDYVGPTGGANGPLTEPAQLIITNDANAQNIDFTTIGDVTGEGNMLVINGIAQGFNILCQQIPVTPNTLYQFQAFAASVITESPAVVQGIINGVPIESVNVPANPGTWVPFSGIWNSGGATTATLCFQDLNNVGIGNDFALDNITFGPLCVSSDQVDIIIPQLDASFDTPDTLCVTEFAITLDDYLGPSATFGGTWFVDGTPDFFFDPAVLGEGLHTVRYSVEVFPCTADSTKNIFVVPPPNSDWVVPGDFCISDPSFDLDDLLAMNAETGGSWNVNGMPATIFDPEDLGAGEHVVIYTAGELSTGCTSDTRDTIEVFPRTIASWTNPSPICEDDPPLTLDSLLNPNATLGGTWTVNGVDTNIVYPNELGPGDVIVSYSVSNSACDSTQTDTITIIGMLDADFSVSEDTICLGTILNVTFTGMANDSTQYFWNFGGGNILSGTGAGPYDIDFSSSGVYSISLWLEEASCASDTATTMVTVIDPLPAPQPICAAIENSSLTFSWSSIPGAVNYSVSVLTGQTGGILMDTSFTIGGLMPNELVQIVVTAEGNAPCLPVASATIDCTTLNCVLPEVTIDDIPFSCMDTASVVPFTLSVNVNPTGGVGAWSGPGIIDTALGVFDPIIAGIGTHIITYEYDINNCSNQDTALAIVYPLPIASFAAADSLCIGDTTILSFDGIIQSMGEYTWDFDGGITISAANNADQQVYWTTAGLKTISLQVEENGCLSTIYEDSILVSPLLELPVLFCTPTETSVTYSWDNQAGVDNYVVTVLSGQSGMMISDTSFLIDGLTPGTDVNISVLAESATPCPDVMVEQACQAVACDTITIDIDPVSDICLDPNLANIPLSVTISDGNTMGSYIWSGDGIIDDTLGIFSPQDAQIGANVISLTYQRGFCFYNASTTITVYETPASDFNIQPDTICVTDQLIVTYTGNASDTATYNWDFDGGNAIPSTGVGPHDIDWPTPGTYMVSLWVEENACISDTLTQMLEVEPLLATTTINCESTYTSVLFSWEDIANVDMYQVNVVQGPMGMMVADTAYLITGLQADEEVMITLDVVSSNNCPSYQLSQTCSALPCPDVSLNITPPPSQCFDGTADTLDLMVVVTNDTGNGVITWDGAGIIDSTLPLWVTDASQIGQPNMVIATWTEDVCVFSDTVMLEVFATPIADFVHDSLICELDTATINFTGTISSIGATFNWDFNGGTLISGNDAGPLEVQWPAPGTYPISLFIIENGCISDTVTSDIIVDPVLESPQISCESTTSTITFSWDPVANASTYQVDVLSGMSGIQTSDTSYVVSGLNALESVSIQVTAISANACPSSTVTEICMTSNCPPVTIEIGAIADQCFDGTADTLALTVVVTNDTANGTITWDGAGIIDPTLPLWVIAAGQVGQNNEVIVTWIDDVCSFSDTLSFNLFETPTASFDLPALACVSDTVLVTFTGNASNVAIYNWDFDGATIISGANEGPYELQWSSAANPTISLWIEDNGCISDTVNQSIQLDPVLAMPIVSCESTFSSILFTWSPVANASSYLVDIDPSLPMGTFLADTAYLINGLQADMMVDILVTAISANACPSVTTTVSCMTLACPDLTLDIMPIPDQCYDGTNDTIMLEVAIIGDIGNGQISWQGDGIIQVDTGLWAINAAQVGQMNQVIVNWQDDICIVSDTAFINVFETPDNAFTVDSAICVLDVATVMYDGNAMNTATFSWDFDGGMVISGSGAGPYQIQWATAGTYTISLEVIENGCSSGIAQQMIIVDPELEMVQIDCESFLSAVEFSWNTIANASGYDVVVLNGGPMGTFLNDTTYRIENLDPQEMVSISVTAISDNFCPSVSVEADCMASTCPNVLIDLNAAATICEGDEVIFEILFSGDQSGPFNLTYTVNGVPTMLDNVSSDIMFSLNPAVTTTFEVTAIEDLGAPTCPPTLPTPITTVVNPPVDAGSSAMPLSICSETDTTVTLSDFLIGADVGGMWTYVSGPALQAGSFDEVNGTFSLLTQEAGTYVFNYALTALPPCPDDNTEVQIIIEETPVADAGNDALLSCGQNEVTLGGANTSTGPNISYVWTSDNGLPITNPNQATITVTQPGNYTLLVTNTANGCSESSTTFVDLDESFLLPFASLTDISCFSANDGGISIDSVNGGTPPYLYAINGAAFTESNVFTGLLPGNYEVLIEDATGCQSTLSFDLTEPGELTVALTANFEGNENEIALGESLTLTANVSIPASEIETIAWQPDSVACDSCLVNIFTPTETSIYSVSIVDVNGCNAFDEMMIFVSREDGVYLPTAFSPNGDGRNDLFTLFTGPQVAEIRVFQIFDRWGEKVHDLQDMMPNDPLLGWDGSFRGEPMNPSVYVYMAEVILIDGTEQVITGDVVLLR